MPVIYVVDVPEFMPLVESARGKSGYKVSEENKGYFKIESQGEMTFNRKEMAMKPALWYGMFTGGLDGEIKSFGREEVTIVGTNMPL